MKSPIKAEHHINSPGRFFHYEPLFTSSFRKNLIIPEAVMLSKGQGVTKSLENIHHLYWNLNQNTGIGYCGDGSAGLFYQKFCLIH
jgi:hypothetical protein